MDHPITNFNSLMSNTSFRSFFWAQTLSKIVINGKFGPEKLLSVLLGDEETPLQNIFGMMIK